MISLPLPRDVEDPAIAAVSRPSVCDVDRSSIGALQRGEGLAILRPGVMGLTVHCAPPFAPTPAVSGEPAPRCRPIVARRLWGCEDSPERRRGAAADRPLPGTPPGDPTPITQSVEEFLSRLRLSSFLLDTYSAYRRLSIGGYGENRFLALKIPKLPPIGTKF